MLNFYTDLAYHFCLNLPTAFTQPGAHLLASLALYLAQTTCEWAIGNLDLFLSVDINMGGARHDILRYDFMKPLDSV